jgi:hypothetical protein
MRAPTARALMHLPTCILCLCTLRGGERLSGLTVSPVSSRRAVESEVAAEIANLLEKLVPRVLEERDPPVPNGVTTMRYRAWRGPFSIRVDNATVLGSVPIYYWAEPGMGMGRLLRTVGAGKSCGTPARPLSINVDFHIGLEGEGTRASLDRVKGVQRCRTLGVDVTARIEAAIVAEFSALTGNTMRTQ